VRRNWLCFLRGRVSGLTRFRFTRSSACLH
jgi:hypothetical protein